MKERSMSDLRRIILRLVHALWPAGGESDLTREIAAHLAILEDECRRRGMTPEEARLAARRAFGGVDQAKESQRDARSFRWLSDARQDVQYASRMLWRAPGFTIAAVLTLALGIGANTAIFTVVHAVMLRPLPFAEPHRLVGIVQQHKSFGVDIVTWPDYVEWRDTAKSFASLAGAWNRVYNLTGIEEPERLPGAAVTPNLFATLGAVPQLGSTFSLDGSTDSHTVILSDRLWKRRFGASMDVVGRTIALNGTRHTVIGVMAPGFAWPEAVELWVPFVHEPGMNAGYHLLQVTGRLTPGTTLAEARAELTAIAAAAAVARPATNKDWGVQLASLLDYTVGPASRPLLILAGAAACVFLIACANVAGLLMSRALTRRREISMRTALGASRSRILRQLVTESFVLAALGGLCGLALADLTMSSLLSLATLPRASGITLDASMFLIALAASGAAGLLFGLLPAIATSRTSVSTAVRTRDAVPVAWLRAALLVVQIAASVVLLAGAGLLLRSFYKLQTVDTGLNIDRVLTARFFLPRASYPVERCVSLYQQMIERMEKLPDVAAAAAVSVFPFSGASANVVFTIEGRPPEAPGNVLTANFSAATPGYFRAMNIPLVAGRGFEGADHAKAPFVAVINQAMADRYFPGQNPIGQFVQILGPLPRQIVGVIPNLRQRALHLPPEPEIYTPHAQFPTGGMFLVVRTKHDAPARIAPDVRAAVRSLDSDVPIASVRTGPELVYETTSTRRQSLVLLSVFAALALMLSVIGVYAVLSFTVSQQTSEIGIRMALGAAPSDVLGMMLKKGLLPVVIGLLGGMGIALASTRVLSQMLFDVRPSDPLTLSAVGLLLLAAASLAVVLPARRATHVDPLLALRCE
jgi:putative ABC transport system permease protein